jgi:hypothetical protein
MSYETVSIGGYAGIRLLLQACNVNAFNIPSRTRLRPFSAMEKQAQASAAFNGGQ